MKRTWPKKRLKFLAAINPSKGASTLLSNVDAEVVFLPMERVSENGEVDQSLRKPISELSGGFTYFERGDLLLAKITPCFENGKAAFLQNLATPVAFGSTEFHVIRPDGNELDQKFCYNLLRSHRFRDEGEAFMSGAAGQKRVPTSFLQDFLLSVPTLTEQRDIANFLDDRTAKIDTLLEKKRRMIELLKEERQAVINQAVTKGLDPNAKMKPSGIEWLGDMPEGWELWKVSQAFSIIGSGTTPKADNQSYYENGTIPWLLTGDLNDGTITSTSKRITQQALQEHSTLKKFPPGSLVIAMYGATIGKLGLLEIETTTNQACCVLGDSIVFETRFVFYWFIANKEKIISLSFGGGQPNISQELLRFLRIQCPPLAQQQSIVAFLDAKTNEIATLIEKAERAIELLTEYRTALITEAVTGRMEVST